MDQVWDETGGGERGSDDAEKLRQRMKEEERKRQERGKGQAGSQDKEAQRRGPGKADNG